jgi:hypothetical protein
MRRPGATSVKSCVYPLPETLVFQLPTILGLEGVVRSMIPPVRPIAYVQSAMHVQV